jgi:hypothetical protein
MKLKNSAFALILTVIASSVALAADPPKPETPVPAKPKPEQVQPAKEQKPMEITGSYIKRNIRRDGRITDGSSQVVVLDRGMIDRSGAADLKQVLIRQGIR